MLAYAASALITGAGVVMGGLIIFALINRRYVTVTGEELRRLRVTAADCGTRNGRIIGQVTDIIILLRYTGFQPDELRNAIESNDPRVYEILPWADLSGEWADEPNSRELFSQFCKVNDIPATLDVIEQAEEEIIDIYIAAYNTAMVQELTTQLERISSHGRTTHDA